MSCPPEIANLLIKIDGYAEKADPTIFECLNLTFTDPEMILDVLRFWPEKYHYSALLYLRKRGIEAWAQDDHNTATEYYQYRLKSDQKFIDIIPLHKRDLAHLNRMINKFLE